MYIQELALNNFRNYGEVNIQLDKGINIFKGDNAQGKTNVLEAIYLCATARSHRTSQEKEVIKWNEEAAHITLDVQKRTFNDKIDFHITQKGKAVAINKLPVAKLGELFGTLTVVMFSPEDLQLIKKSPKERRRFIDIELCQFNKLYYYALKQYYKVLKQRNNALKQYQQNPNPDMLDIWDMQYVEYAKEVIRRRSEFIQEINEVAKKIHANISGGKEDLEVVYEPNVLEANIEEKVARYRQKDIMTQSSSVGPHRDDLKFLINGMDVKVYGSQGQQRTVVLSMKLAELRLMQENLGEAPILLLDDVLSELDDSRQKYLFSYTENIQTLITCTGVEQSVWNSQKVGKLYNVVKGNIY
ncbi:MAG: DNA replication/repair protein RecF [Niameybacter sp.]|nr:DNA replication/repair protein RecF [Niameybacter sp.]